MVRNPYAEAAARKLHSRCKLNLQPAIPGGMSIYTSGMQAFIEAGGPRKSMMQSIHASALSLPELQELLGMFERGLAEVQAVYPDVRVNGELAILRRVLARKTGA